MVFIRLSRFGEGHQHVFPPEGGNCECGAQWPPGSYVSEALLRRAVGLRDEEEGE